MPVLGEGISAGRNACQHGAEAVHARFHYMLTGEVPDLPEERGRRSVCFYYTPQKWGLWGGAGVSSAPGEHELLFRVHVHCCVLKSIGGITSERFDPQGRWLVSKFKGIHSSAITSKPTNGGKTRLLGGWCWAGLWLYLISQTVIWWPSHVLLCVCLPWSLCSMAGARAEFCLRSSCLQGSRCQLCSAHN